MLAARYLEEGLSIVPVVSHGWLHSPGKLGGGGGGGGGRGGLARWAISRNPFSGTFTIPYSGGDLGLNGTSGTNNSLPIDPRLRQLR